MKRFYLLIFILSICFNKGFNQTFIKDSLDRYIEEGIRDWKIPGLSLIIIKDGKVIKKQGYGVRNIQSKERVDENTLFFIASNSKLFTGTSLAKLHIEKKLSLNDKITKYYKDFKLYDKNSSELVTIKDMLTHRIGTKTFQGDFTFWNTNFSREQIMDKMKFLKPVSDFRDAYGYCNSCFLVAGMVIPKVTGKEWENYITTEIIKPLKMNSTSALSNEILKYSKNIATPYSTSFTNQLTEVPYDKWDNLGPAASIVSNINDLENWLRFQLDSGKFENKIVMPWSVLQLTRDVVTVTGSRKSSSLPVHFRGYGLGVFSADYNGRQIYWHTGGAAGMLSNVCFVPEEKLGIAILTNNDNQNFFELLRYQILDDYLNVPYQNRSKNAIHAFNSEMNSQIDEINKLKQLALDNKNHNLNLKQYLGEYKNELYGKIKIVQTKSNELEVSFLNHKDLKATMSYLGNDEWLLAFNNIEYGIFKTKFTKAGNKIKSVIIKVNDFVEMDPYEFIKA